MIVRAAESTTIYVICNGPLAGTVLSDVKLLLFFAAEERREKKIRVTFSDLERKGIVCVDVPLESFETKLLSSRIELVFSIATIDKGLCREDNVLSVYYFG